MKALTEAVNSSDLSSVEALFGPGIHELLSGDTRQDEIEFARFAKALKAFSAIERQGADRCVIHLGPRNWPYPIPLVLRNGGWIFDTAAGKDEILSRRIGADERNAIRVCRAYVLAQREYGSEDHDGSGLVKYAERLRSSPGTRDGLYWPAGPQDEQSPFGPLVAEARSEGYGGHSDHGGAQPYMGYLFKILTAQGQAAPGGAYSYIVHGNLVAGFALVAYPAHWGESGIMTFIVNQAGKVYERNLGPDSAAAAEAMDEYDPDGEWTAVATP